MDRGLDVRVVLLHHILINILWVGGLRRLAKYDKSPMPTFLGLSNPHFIYPNGVSEEAEPPDFFKSLGLRICFFLKEVSHVCSKLSNIYDWECAGPVLWNYLVGTWLIPCWTR